MSSYRIVSERSIDSFEHKQEFFYIQKTNSWFKRKLGFYWTFIYIIEDVKQNRPRFESYEEAETYLYHNYFKGNGEIFKSGNVYSFREYFFGF
jgi:hypothetical protein